MNTELIELYRKIQPLCPKDRIVGDRLYFVPAKTEILFTFDDLCAEKPFDIDEIFIPDVVSRDPDRPERGLLGMVNDIAFIDTFLDKKDIAEWSVSLNIGRRGHIASTYGKTLEEALLRAIIWQMEMEEEEIK